MDKKAPHELKFAFKDFLDLLRRHKKLVIFGMFLGALACFSLAVTRPSVYLLQGSFRDKGKTQAAIRSSLSDMFFSSVGSSDSEAISTMKSRKLISEVIQKLHLQGDVGRVDIQFPRIQHEIENAIDNLYGEWAYQNEYNTPILEDIKKIFELRDIAYNDEIARAYLFTFTDSTHFDLAGEDLEGVIKGELGQPVRFKETAFTIHNPENTPISVGDSYAAILMPVQDIAKSLVGNMTIELDHDDKTLLKLQFKHRNRQFAANFLNTLMEIYQNRLIDEHEITSDTQVNYLEKRQKQVGADLEKLMEAHVQNISQDMSKTGFTSLQREMDFLAANLANNTQKMTELDLEVKRLENLNVDECVHYDSYLGRGDIHIINNLLTEIRNLNQQSDAIEFAIQNSSRNTPAQSQETLDSYCKNLDHLNGCHKETEQLIRTLQGDHEGIVFKQLDDPKYPISSWYATYKGKEKAWIIAPFAEKAALQQDFEAFREHFLSYLDAFQRMLKIQIATLEQRMRTLQQPDPEFESLTLEPAKNLYVSYVRELNDLQSAEKQHRFVVEQLNHPHFELSSLTALLHDPISHERIGKATQLIMSIKDENNHTQKEIERLNDQLKLQKTFLGSHTTQMADLLQIKQQVLKDKMAALQAMILSFTHQQISLLKKHLKDYVEKRIENLNQERNLLVGHQKALHSRMGEIPSKWASEQLLNHHLTMQQRFLENLAGMVESKNITKNLEMIQSTTLDKALPTLNPKPPRLLFYSLLGSIIGFLGVSTFLFTRVMIQGVPASIENLRLSNYHVSGKITPFQGDEMTATTPLLDNDLDTLRRLVAHYEEESPLHPKAHKLLIIQGNAPDISNTLAKLLSKKGQRALKLQLNFKQANEPRSSPGLIQYLEGKIDSAPIEELDGFDLISAGGVSRYSEELLRSPRFMRLLDTVSPNYDWVIGVTPAKIPSAEAENLAKLFDGTVVMVTDQALQDLIAFSETLDDQHREALTFVVAPKV